MGVQDPFGIPTQNETPVFLKLKIILISVQILKWLQIADETVSAVQYDTDAVFTMARGTDDLSFYAN